MISSNLSIETAVVFITILFTGLTAGLCFTWTNAVTPGIGQMDESGLFTGLSADEQSHNKPGIYNSVFWSFYWSFGTCLSPCQNPRSCFLAISPCRYYFHCRRGFGYNISKMYLLTKFWIIPI